jgi:CHAT domain-containing protein/tetratricopeptide (TPR) repeat protein
MTDDIDAEPALRASIVAYGKSGDPEFLDQAIALADDITRGAGFRGLSPGEAAVIWSLGGAARIHRSRLGIDKDDLDDAIAWCRRALETAGDTDSNSPAYASNLATILADRYERDENRADLDEALALFEWSVPAIKAAGGRTSVAQHNQGMALTDLYEANRDMATLNRAIDVLREASADTAEPREVVGGYLNSLGQALRAKAEAASDPSALNEAVRVLRQARAWTAGSDDHVAVLVSLGNTLLDRSEIGRPVQDLEESVECLEQALALVPRSTARWGHIASNLANALVAMFRATGRQSPLLRARDLFTDAADALADPREREIAQSNLAACLQDLHDETGEVSFLDEAIEVFRRTVREPAGSAVPERRQNFGVALLTRFKRYLSPADLEQAIDQFRAVASLSAEGSVIHAAATNSLGNALSLRFDLLEHEEDSTAAILAYEEAVRSARPDSIDRAMYQANLGVSLLRRAERSHSAADIDAAVAQQEIAAANVPQASQEYIRVLAGLADSLAARAASTGGDADAKRAREAYRSVTTAALERLPEQAIGSARSWGTWAASRESFPEAAEAWSYGLEAMEQLFRGQVTRLHKETWLRDAQGMSVQAAYALARTCDPAGACAALERGRALLLSETLQRDRADLEQLTKTGRADLHERYEAAVSRWNLLSRTGDRSDLAGPALPGVPGTPLTATAEDLRQARQQLDAVIAEIRTVPGYQRFLQPPAFDDVVADAGAHPLVYVGAADAGGLALIIRPASASAETVWLPALTEDALAAEVRAYRDAYEDYLNSPRTGTDRAQWESAIDAVAAFAWTTLMGPLLTALGTVPCVTLVPIGLLGVLPLHAAWTPDPACATGRRYALDQTALTYAPNAQALGAARIRHQEIEGEHLVAVDEPYLGAAGSRLPLPYSALEVAAAVATFGDHEVLSGREATADSVLSALARAQCFHLSCHGRADPANPLDASLAMAGGKPLTLRDVLDRRLSARLGILSACETAIPGDDLPDEVVALPAGLIQAGVAMAVGSLWSVPGAATALLMFRFYERWRVRGDEPAAALGDAQRWLRDTTNGEKLSYFEDIALDDDHPMSGAAQEPYELLFRAAAEPLGRDYGNPYHWAAFTCMGA